MLFPISILQFSDHLVIVSNNKKKSDLVMHPCCGALLQQTFVVILEAIHSQVYASAAQLNAAKRFWIHEFVSYNTWYGTKFVTQLDFHFKPAVSRSG